MEFNKQIISEIYTYFYFSQDELYLNRCWYSINNIIPGYKFIGCTDPVIQEVNFDNRIFHLEDCGQLLYKKQKLNTSNRSL